MLHCSASSKHATLERCTGINSNRCEEFESNLLARDQKRVENFLTESFKIEALLKIVQIDTYRLRT